MSDDEVFAQLTDGLDITQPPEQISYRSLNNFELIQRFGQVRSTLRLRGEIINPTTALGKDLGAVYHGLVLELRKRRLM